MNILINILGIIIFFWVRYTNRGDKTTEPDPLFWLKDNYEQLTAIVLFDIVLMVLRSKQALSIDLDQIGFLPSWIKITGDFAICFIIGVLGAYLVYEGYKKLVIDKR